MIDAPDVNEIMDRIRQRVRLRHPVADVRNLVESTSAARIPVPPLATLSHYDLGKLHHNLHASNSQWNKVGLINPRGPGLFNRLLQLVKKTLQRMLTWYTRPLHEFHASVVRVLNETTNAIENLQENEKTINSRVDQHFAELVGKSERDRESLAKQLDGLVSKFDERLREWDEKSERDRDSLAKQLDGLVSKFDERLRLTERKIRTLIYQSDGTEKEKDGRAVLETSPIFASELPSDSGFDYFLFEERWRGSEDEIESRQKSYLSYFAGMRDVVDVGCGRGEFLELLRANGIPARGVEINTDMFLLCKEKGLDVLHADLFSFLETLSAGSLGGIFCSQVIEHMPAGQQLKLLALAKRTLKPGAPLLVETINPECILALARNFFLDPTHVRPVHPEMLRFALQSMGFKNIELKFAAPADLGQKFPKLVLAQSSSELDRLNDVLERMNALLFGYQDYAAICTR